MAKLSDKPLVQRNIRVTTELDEFVQDELRSGNFANYSEVIRAALRTYRLEVAHRQLQATYTPKRIQEALESIERGDYVLRSDIAAETLRRF